MGGIFCFCLILFGLRYRAFRGINEEKSNFFIVDFGTGQVDEEY